MIPRGVDLEIVEKKPAEHISSDVQVVLPNELRINGIPVLVPSGSVQIAAGDDEVAVATLRVYCRSVRIEAEPSDEPDEDPPIFEGVKHFYDLDPFAVAVGIRGYINVAKAAAAVERLTGRQL